MGPDLDMGNESRMGMEVMAGKGNGSLVQECVNNYEDRNLCVENLHEYRAKVQCVSENLEVNIVDCTDSLDNVQVEARSADDTETMSSFGDTEYEDDSGTEVESQPLLSGSMSSIFDTYGTAFGMRRKKLTDHWRRFIRPLMWRCKWLELQIKEYQSQALKYDRELAEYKNKKLFDFGTLMVGSFLAKSLPFSSRIGKNKVLKRKKRKRAEDTADIASYVLQHNLFSYYENRKSDALGVYMNDSGSNPDKTITGNVQLGFQNGLISVESSGGKIQEDALRKIERLQLHVRRLKARIDKVMTDNPMKFSMSLPAECDALTISDHNPPLHPGTGDGVPIKSPNSSFYLKPDYDMGDIKPEIAVSSHKAVTTLPDMIESVGQPQIASPFENVADEILHHDDAAKNDEKPLVQNIGSRSPEKYQPPTEKQGVQASEPKLPVARARYSGKSLPKGRSNVMTKRRKRGKRKSAAGRWGRKSLA